MTSAKSNFIFIRSKNWGGNRLFATTYFHFALNAFFACKKKLRSALLFFFMGKLNHTIEMEHSAPKKLSKVLND